MLVDRVVSTEISVVVEVSSGGDWATINPVSVSARGAGAPRSETPVLPCAGRGRSSVRVLALEETGRTVDSVFTSRVTALESEAAPSPFMEPRDPTRSFDPEPRGAVNVESTVPETGVRVGDADPR